MDKCREVKTKMVEIILSVENSDFPKEYVCCIQFCLEHEILWKNVDQGMCFTHMRHFAWQGEGLRKPWLSWHKSIETRLFTQHGPFQETVIAEEQLMNTWPNIQFHMVVWVDEELKWKLFGTQLVYLALDITPPHHVSEYIAQRQEGRIWQLLKNNYRRHTANLSRIW